jgi:predicted PurR-regulated permease PerM
MTSPPPAQDLVRATLGVLCIGALIAANFWVLQPFLAPLIWAATIVVATWPLMLRVQGWIRGSRGFAVAVMTFTLLLLLIAPLAVAVLTIVESSGRIVSFARTLGTESLPALPGWVAGIPLVGARLEEAWHQLADAGRDGVAARLTPYVGRC